MVVVLKVVGAGAHHARQPDLQGRGPGLITKGVLTFSNTTQPPYIDTIQPPYSLLKMGHPPQSASTWRDLSFRPCRSHSDAA